MKTLGWICWQLSEGMFLLNSFTRALSRGCTAIEYRLAKASIKLGYEPSVKQEQYDAQAKRLIQMLDDVKEAIRDKNE